MASEDEGVTKYRVEDLLTRMETLNRKKEMTTILEKFKKPKYTDEDLFNQSANNKKEREQQKQKKDKEEDAKPSRMRDSISELEKQVLGGLSSSFSQMAQATKIN